MKNKKTKSNVRKENPGNQKKKEKKQRQERIEKKKKTRIGHRHFCPATF